MALHVRLHALHRPIFPCLVARQVSRLIFSRSSLLYRGHPLLSCARVLLKILTRMLCKGCGDQLEDGNRYAHRVNERVYYSNCCRGCKRGQVLTVYHLRKQHPKPPVGTPCDCCGCVDKLQLDHEHGGSRKWRGWVCRNCNVGLGHLGDSSAGLLRALAYLIAAKERESCSTQEANGVVALE